MATPKTEASPEITQEVTTTDTPLVFEQEALPEDPVSRRTRRAQKVVFADEPLDQGPVETAPPEETKEPEPTLPKNTLAEMARGRESIAGR